MNKLRCLVLLFYVYLQVSDVVFCHTVESGILTRQKRGLFCMFGLKDKVIKALQDTLKEIQKLDPVYFKDNIPINSEIRIHDGTLKGLSSLTNVTEMIVICNEGDLLKFNTTLMMSGVSFSYNWTRKGFPFIQKGILTLRAGSVDYKIQMTLNVTGGMNFKITNSKLTANDFGINFSGLGIWDPLVNLGTSIWSSLYKKNLELGLGFALRYLLQQKLHIVGNTYQDTFIGDILRL